MPRSAEASRTPDPPHLSRRLIIPGLGRAIQQVLCAARGLSSAHQAHREPGSPCPWPVLGGTMGGGVWNVASVPRVGPATGRDTVLTGPTAGAPPIRPEPSFKQPGRSAHTQSGRLCAAEPLGNCGNSSETCLLEARPRSPGPGPCSQHPGQRAWLRTPRSACPFSEHNLGTGPIEAPHLPLGCHRWTGSPSRSCQGAGAGGAIWAAGPPNAHLHPPPS